MRFVVVVENLSTSARALLRHHCDSTTLGVLCKNMASNLSTQLSLCLVAAVFILLQSDAPSLAQETAAAAGDDNSSSVVILPSRYRNRLFFLPWNGALAQQPLERLRSEIESCKGCVHDCKAARCGHAL